MAIHPRAIIIGLTAPFGSGSSTSAEILADRLHFKSVRLSTFIKKEFEKDNPGKKSARADLQSYGDQMRRRGHLGILADLAQQFLEEDATEHSRIVIDGIRNVSEIEFLRDRFGNRFYLFALECPQSDRWERLTALVRKTTPQDGGFSTG